jgi:phosphoribosylaminoimidazole-succinocarboxamide synthase
VNLPLPPERALPDRLARWQAVRVTDLPLELPGYLHVYSGKVRDLYAPLSDDGQVVEDQLLLVASNRLSAYDWMMSPEIPDKGAVLTRLSLWWFDQLADLVPNHVVSTDVPDAVAGRGVLVRRLDMLKVEAIARAYLTGGGLEEYREKGSVSGVVLPDGLVDGSRLPEPVFTPTTKAPVGEHDLPMSPDEVEAELGAEVAAEVSRLTRAILARGNEIAAERGILIADTKVEFGLSPDGTGGLVLADEVLTPDSSRFWPAEQWEPGHSQPSYDKQFVRDWLTSSESGWDRKAGGPPPELPQHVVEQTRAKYVEAYERLTGQTF